MGDQTEAEISISKIIKKSIRGAVDPELFEKVAIQIVICDRDRKVMAVKLPKDLLDATQMNYSNVMKAARQQFHDYFIIFIRNFEAETSNGGVIKRPFVEKEANWLANVCFPFLLTGLRTDVRSVNESVVNVLLEKRASFNRNEMEMIGAALGGLLGRNYVVSVNHHTRN